MLLAILKQSQLNKDIPGRSRSIRRTETMELLRHHDGANWLKTLPGSLMDCASIELVLNP